MTESKRGLTHALLLALLLLLLGAAPLAAQDATYGYAGDAPRSGYDTDGQSVDSIAVFFEPLSHYGRWLDTRYGRAWAPNVPRDWRPYTIGHWEDGRYGVTWRSDEPFGWAVFHFGRWAFDAAVGWVWLPDIVWGPGWVAWRDGDDVTGWAPLPPQVGVFALGGGYGFNDWGFDQWYQPGWVYVPRPYLYARSLRGAYLPLARNRDVWERTRGVTHYDRVDGQVVNHSFAPRGGDRGNDRGRDYAGRELRGTPLYGTTRQAPPPVQGDGAVRDGYVPPLHVYGGRDGFVPGAPRGVDRRSGAPTGMPGRPTLPPAALPPAMPPPRAAPPAPRPAPPARQAARPNPNERPR